MASFLTTVTFSTTDSAEPSLKGLSAEPTAHAPPGVTGPPSMGGRSQWRISAHHSVAFSLSSHCQILTLLPSLLHSSPQVDSQRQMRTALEGVRGRECRPRFGLPGALICPMETSPATCHNLLGKGNEITYAAWLAYRRHEISISFLSFSFSSP